MKAKRYSTEFKSSIVTLYNEGRSANSLANEYHLAAQTSAISILLMASWWSLTPTAVIWVEKSIVNY
ncbi:hypothetical protein BMS83_08790 [Leuconostoc pseudomesenteroides]|nr:hypothetical protein BMS83_08790 [Leuconostoc pseudomesenteroides]